MDIMQLIGFLAPVLAIGFTQFLKKWIASRWAPLLVFALGGISTLIGVGPSPGGGFVDATVNVAFVSGGAVLIYDLFKKLKGSKAIKIPIVLLAIVLALSITACAGFEANTYKTLYTLGTAYDAAMKSAKVLYDQDKFDTDQAKKIIEYANAYYVAYQEAVIAFEIYKATSSAQDKEKLITVLAEVSNRQGEMLIYIERLKKP